MGENKRNWSIRHIRDFPCGDIIVPVYGFYDDGIINFEFVRFSEIPACDRKPFLSWMEGQTMPCVRAVEPDKPEDAVYFYDYDRWRNWYYQGIPTYFD